jgi:hypothetical protein
MNKLLLLFIILLLGLMLCSFLGGNCYTEGFKKNDTTKNTGVSANTSSATMSSSSDNTDSSTSLTSPSTSPSTTSYDNYNHYNQTSYPTKYYGPNGTTATIINTNGTYTLAITETSGTTTIYNVNAPSSSPSSSPSSNITSTTFYGQNGGTAKVTTDSNGNYIINVTQQDGTTNIYTVTNTQSTIVPPPQQPTTQSSTYTSGQNYSYYNGPNVNAGSVSTPSGTTYDFITGPQGNTVVGESSNKPTFPGLPKGMIPKGQEDLYILKSQVVPPVCPVCPTCPVPPPNSTNGGSEKCPPCPACARCPEPAFECKKVPNYNSAGSSQFLPMPVMSDFSSFGM